MRNHIKIRTLSADSVCHDANFYRTVCVYVPEYVMRVCVRSRAFVCVYARMCGVCVYARMRGVCFVYARMRGVCVCMPECVVYVCVCVCVCPNAWCVYVPECVCNLALCSAGTIHRFMFKMIWRKIWVGLNNEPDFMRWKTNMDFKPWPVKTFRKSKILIQIMEKKNNNNNNTRPNVQGSQKQNMLSYWCDSPCKLSCSFEDLSKSKDLEMDISRMSHMKVSIIPVVDLFRKHSDWTLEVISGSPCLKEMPKIVLTSTAHTL